MATLTDFTDAQLRADGVQGVKKSSLRQLLVDAVAALELAIFGGREGGVVPHDHGTLGGALLLRALVSLGWSYVVAEGGGPAALGLPLWPPNPGISFATTPKLLASVGVLVPGGVDQVYGELLAALPTVHQTASLMVELRPLSDVGYGPGGNLGLKQAVTFAAGGSTYYAQGFSWASIAPLAPVNADRWLELCLWQTSDTPAGGGPTYRAAGLALWPGAASAQPLPVAAGSPWPHVQLSEILGGSFLTEKLLRRGRLLLDALTYGALGKVPGKIDSWAAGGDSPDRSAAWTKAITGVHQHTGRALYDGAVLRHALAANSYSNWLHEDGLGTCDAAGYLGQITDPSGTGLAPFANLTTFSRRVSVAAGCRVLHLRLALLPGTINPSVHLHLYANVISVDPSQSNNLALAVGGAAGTGHPLVPVFGWVGGEVAPIDGEAFVRNQFRTVHGRSGHWTVNAQLQTLPAGVVESNGLYRASEVVRIELADHDTGDYIVQVRIHMTNDDDTTATDLARLQWLTVVPAPNQ